MALESLDRSPPPFFRVGFAPLTKLFFFSALSVLLMFGDKQLQFTKPIRAGLSTLIMPVQWLVLQPGQVASSVGDYFQNLDQAQKDLQALQLKQLQQSARAQQVEQLLIENQNLRQLLDLKNTVATPSQVAEILFDVPDPYNQRIVIDKGQTKEVVLGSPVIDAGGVIGQVTRVYPLTAEVTLLTDRDQSIPVMNSRTGARNISSGNIMSGTPLIELKFVPASADVKEGDLLTTSGIDGVYPAGLQVARISHIERRVDISFARIHATPLAELKGRHVLVLQPTGIQAASKGKAP
ncbi:rod shape-determining protein MreC [Limnohabitans sp. Rim11]|uniref:rod shape-determining protein MreC n=1 Tax=Limnohabitans sp. Rim11 TaxID=1100719 RepID=UPI000B323DD1|nr:rod shape-determining protein MreC [Limnohabitans sp. Rim11]